MKLAGLAPAASQFITPDGPAPREIIERFFYL